MGTNSQTSIEINGKRYDARTGKLFPSDTLPPTDSAAPARKLPSDVRPRPAAVPITVHKPAERSKTLMRHAVKRPTPHHHTKPAAVHTMSDISRSPQPKHTVAASAAASRLVDKKRAERATQVQRSALVSKYSDIMSKPSGSVAGIPNPTQHSHEPVAKRVQPLAVQAAPVLAQLPVSIPSNHRTESVLARGLREAQSHNQTAPHVSQPRTKRAKRGRFATIGASAMAVLLLSAFIAYQYLPNIAIRYAATRAGISAELPGYRPAGFALSSRIQYNPGQIKINFGTNTDDRNFSITQRSTNWNSEALMSNYVAAASEQVQTYEDKGRTIYLYGDSNATWVNGGIWYDIKGNSQLNSDQLIRIATSM